MKLLAYTLFYIGDRLGRIAFRYSWAWNGYQWFMGKSMQIQDKYNLDGPWEKPKL